MRSRTACPQIDYLLQPVTMLLIGRVVWVVEFETVIVISAILDRRDRVASTTWDWVSQMLMCRVQAKFKFGKNYQINGS